MPTKDDHSISSFGRSLHITNPLAARRKKMKEQYFHIEYEIGKTERHEKLEILFQRIKEEKEKYYETGDEPSSEIEDWIKYLDNGAKEWFNKIVFKPNSEQRKIYDQLWKLSKPEIRIKHPMFNTGDSWRLDSMIYVIFEGDYELIKIEKTENKGILFYNPRGAPFGGTESLVYLIESFGNKVTYDYWHEGPHLRPEIGWDFELAKQLVEKGKGVESINQVKEISTNRKSKSAKKEWWKFWK